MRRVKQRQHVRHYRSGKRRLINKGIRRLKRRQNIKKAVFDTLQQVNRSKKYQKNKSLFDTPEEYAKYMKTKIAENRSWINEVNRAEDEKERLKKLTEQVKKKLEAQKEEDRRKTFITVDGQILPYYSKKIYDQSSKKERIVENPFLVKLAKEKQAEPIQLTEEDKEKLAKAIKAKEEQQKRAMDRFFKTSERYREMMKDVKAQPLTSIPVPKMEETKLKPRFVKIKISAPEDLSRVVDHVISYKKYKANEKKYKDRDPEMMY